MSTYTDRAITAGLPVYSGDETHLTYSRNLTAAEELTAESIERELFPERYPTEQKFLLPISTPRLTTEEVILRSPKPMDTPQAALAQALELSLSKDKPIGEILLNAIVVIVDMNEQIKELKEKIK